MTEEYPKVKQSKKWKATLFDHQLTAIHLLEEREQNKTIIDGDIEIETNIGIFADPTGYGKTLSVCGLLSRDKLEWDTSTPIHKTVISDDKGESMYIKIKKHYQFKKIKTNLLLVNQSIIKQWENELKLMNVSYKVIDKRKLVDEIDVTKYNLIITIPTMYNRLIQKYDDVYWKRFIYDEPVNIHVPRMNTVRASYYWLVTATPNQLRQISYSSQHMIRNIFNYYLNTNTYKYLIVKNDLEYVKSSYVFPETNYITHKCYQPLYNMCINHTDTLTSEMISAGNILGAIRRLGGNETSNIFELIKQRLQHKIEDLTHSLSIATRQHNQNNIERYTGKIKTVEKQITEIKQKYTERLEGECAICISKLEKPVLITCCQNVMCGSCILEWNKEKSNCPLCRTITTPESFIYIKRKNESPSTQPKFKRNLTKPETILEIINNNKKGKFMIFSNYSETFANIYNVLQINCISFKELKGQTTTRNKILKRFKEGETKVLFLNSQSNGAGINLQEATDIILYHQLDKDLETQVIGRANRIGRKDSLFVHQLN
jgi:hypothetical protein